ncbi:MAG TPA: KpsF/GutQ family sugar-phosphate isomerase [Thermodesulfobacteriota bacterium]|nr:KpsF/GutQ family sugar-phosphate isomerase [Thermodesulfobacteriota bacterium]HUL38334.1 KpsF/GutQ family sugar-phosphate isomerase [Thermodesulfobacteriota bacterium]
MDSIKEAKRVLRVEAQSILDLAERIDENFSRAVELLYHCKGKVVLMGMGKSGLVGRKIASTFASTGTPAFFLHPAEGLNGDFGMLAKEDVIIAISNSGETRELLEVLPLIKRYGNRLITLTGNSSSTLAKGGDVHLDVRVKEEACPLGLAPTASTTVTLALGDALAVALMEKRDFKKEDFAILHPGGALGKRLLLKVDDLMHTGKAFPTVSEKTLMKDAVFEITSKRLGVTAVCNAEGHLVGVITDGDLRRALEKFSDLFNREASEVMTKNPKWIERDALAAKAVQRMEEYSITSLFVFEKGGDKVPVGIIHLHDLLKAGVV